MSWNMPRMDKLETIFAMSIPRCLSALRERAELNFRAGAERRRDGLLMV
jgi:hypothetical protein